MQEKYETAVAGDGVSRAIKVKKFLFCNFKIIIMLLVGSDFRIEIYMLPIFMCILNINSYFAVNHQYSSLSVQLFRIAPKRNNSSHNSNKVTKTNAFNTNTILRTKL